MQIDNNACEFCFSDADCRELLAENENELFERIGASLAGDESSLYDKSNSTIKSFIFYGTILIIAIFFIGELYYFLSLSLFIILIALFICIFLILSMLQPALCKDRKKERKLRNTSSGKYFYLKHIHEIQAILCKNGEPCFWVNEVTGGEVRNIAMLLVTAMSVQWAVAVYLTILVLKIGLNKFCALK